MAEEPDKTASEAPGESVTTDAVASEAQPVEQPLTPANVLGTSEQEREAFLNELARRVAAQLQPPPASPSPSPTPATGGLEALEREAASILEAEKALAARVEREGGWSADTMLARQDLVERRSAVRAEAAIVAVREMETQQRVTQFGTEDRWKEFYRANRHRGDVELLRAAFERDEDRRAKEAAAGAPKPPVLPRKTEPTAPVVDVSAPSEVTAAERKARTMTMDAVREAKKRFEEAGDAKAIRDLDRKIRDGEILLK